MDGEGMTHTNQLVQISLRNDDANNDYDNNDEEEVEDDDEEERKEVRGGTWTRHDSHSP
jgi:hypothetical protein